MPSSPRLNRRLLLVGLAALPLALAAGHPALTRSALAQSADDQAGHGNPDAAGLWRTIDDETGKPRSLVRISERDGRWYGRIEKLFREPGEDPDPVCHECTDTRAGQKITGMEILTGLVRDGLSYEGGEILDPKNGEIYDAKMTLSPDGNTLEVRGFIGLSLFGRSQTWIREG
ncbi:DUF2147 domain-containing protein [Tistrella mobilis]|uniref:Signal peptide protein n=1 Tax=Tistrella mobilis (strain KA081020-065) TaxID=1110502 RepID=I3TJF0_TISMK|nr:DUF2147 domain-containing protein [Tistrella mobilis]AFK52888.1 signal peptide protein [Tistrella mobilis KA081020-065]MAM76486.1 DUF2147 domain-containing protein [Tistrella sp.]